MKTSVALSLVVLLVATRCATPPPGQPGGPTGQVEYTSTAASVPSAELVATLTLADLPQPPAATPSPDGALSPIARAQADLASRLGVAEGQVQFVGLAPVAQSGDALECPSPSAKERVMVVDPEGQRYELPQKGSLPDQNTGMLLFFTVGGKSYVYYQEQGRVILCPDLE